MVRLPSLLLAVPLLACTHDPGPAAVTDTGTSSSGGPATTDSPTSSTGPTSTGGPSPDEACGEIVGACHSKDDGTDPTISDCHEIGHSGTAECIEQVDACVAYCDAAPPVGGETSTGTESSSSTTGPDLTSGTDGESSSTGSTTELETGTTGGPSPACESYCACMSATCQQIAGYPWGDDSACLEACAGYDAPEMTCWSMWCTEAKKGALVVHLCEHAWGKFGLDEC